MKLRFLVEKEFRQFARNSFMPRLAVIFPLVVILVFPLVTTFEVKNISFIIVDNDHSTLSRRLTDKIANSPYFTLYETVPSYDDALEQIAKGNTDVILSIPPDFEKTMITGARIDLQVSANAVNGIKGNLGSGYMGNVLTDFISEISQERGMKPPLPANITVQYKYNRTLNYKSFMIPALVTMVLIMLCAFLPSLNIVSEKEQGTIEQINVSPVSKSQFILAKLIPYWLMGLVVMSICFLIAWLVYGFLPVGSFGLIYLAAIIFVFVVSGIGLIISNYSATMQQAIFVMFFIVMIFMLMSGLFTSIQSMPEWAQWIAVFNPPRYFISIMRSVYLKGGAFADNIVNYGMLLIFAVCVNIWAVLSYRKQS